MESSSATFVAIQRKDRDERGAHGRGRLPPERIKALRKRLGRTQAECAAALGVARNTVARWEMGASQPRGLSLKALLALYEASPEPRYLVQVRTWGEPWTSYATNSLANAQKHFDRWLGGNDRRWRRVTEVVLIERGLETDTVLARHPPYRTVRVQDDRQHRGRAP